MQRPLDKGQVGACLELFSGSGGLALGVEEAGFQHAGLVEFNQDARATIAKMSPLSRGSAYVACEKRGMKWYAPQKLTRFASVGSGMTEEEFLESAKRGRIGGGIDAMEFCPEPVLKGKRPLAFCATFDEMAPKIQDRYRSYIESGKIGYLEVSDSTSHGIFFVPGNEAKANAFADAVRDGNDVLMGLLLGYSPDDVNRYMSQEKGYEEALKQWAKAEAFLG